MADAKKVTETVEQIVRQLETLKEQGVLGPFQLQSIKAQLPDESGHKSTYKDPNFGPNKPAPGQVQHEDPNHPSHPDHQDHGAWKKFGSQAGGIAMRKGIGHGIGAAFNALG